MTWAQNSTFTSAGTESLLVGHLNGSLCWMEVTEEGGDGGRVRVESTPLPHCHRSEGENRFMPSLDDVMTYRTKVPVYLFVIFQLMEVKRCDSVTELLYRSYK